MSNKTNTEKGKLLLSGKGLSSVLGSTAILEGSVGLDEVSSLKDILEEVKGVFSPTLTLLGLYYDQSPLQELPKSEIDTIMIHSTFAYQDKILSLYSAIVGIYKATGWKPKRIVNTMDYGLKELYMLCNPLGIEVFYLKEEYGLKGDDDQFSLKETTITGMDYDFAKIAYHDLLEAANNETPQQSKGK